MRYYIRRGGQEWGPYTLEDLRLCLSRGNIVATDQTRSEGSSDCVPLVQVLAATTPAPLGLHWALVLVFSYFSWGVFGFVWALVECFYVRKIDRESNAIVYQLVSIALWGAVIYGSLVGPHRPNPDVIAAAVAVMALGFWLQFVMASFSMRASLMRYFNSVQPIGLKMSRPMVFFFNVVYIQYHLARIARWKRTGVLA